jgi:hypothetical protein
MTKENFMNEKVCSDCQHYAPGHEVCCNEKSEHYRHYITDDHPACTFEYFKERQPPMKGPLTRIR